MTPLRTVSRFVTIGLILGTLSGCEAEYWFNADGSGRYRIIYSQDDIKLLDPKGEGFEKKADEFKQTYAKTKLRAKMTREVVYGKTRWIQDLEYDSADQLSWTDDEGKKQNQAQWTITTEPNDDLKYTYNNKLESNPRIQGGVETGSPRRVTAHLPGRIVTSNADAVDTEKNVAKWETTNHRSIKPTVTVRLSR